MNSTPSSAALIMLFTALPPAPPTPTTVILGLISDSFWGRLRLIVIRALHANEGLFARSNDAGLFFPRTSHHRRLCSFLSTGSMFYALLHNILPKSYP